MKQELITIKMPHGDCTAWATSPDGAGPWPAVIMYMDAFGLRPAMKEMALHISSQGYVVLQPDLFYRHGAYGPLNPKEIFAAGAFREKIGPLMASTDNLRAANDTADFLNYLDSRADVAPGARVGTVGFCMGGGMALAAAGTYPDRVAAAASFHGARLATDQPTSPHLLFPRIKGEVYIAGADQDEGYPPEMHERVKKSLSEAGVRFRAEIYEGKKHGWMKPDMPVYDAEGAARGWKELFALYSRTLR